MTYTIKEQETESYFENPWNESLYSFTSTSRNLISNMNSDIDGAGFSSWEEAQDKIMKKSNLLNRVINVLNHSGVSLSLEKFGGCYGRFDSYPMGIVTVSEEQAKSYFRFVKGIKRITKKYEVDYTKFVSELEENLILEMEHLEGYMNGQTFTEYVIIDENEDEIEYFENEQAAQNYIDRVLNNCENY
jgi:hypothetical protein